MPCFSNPTKPMSYLWQFIETSVYVSNGAETMNMGNTAWSKLCLSASNYHDYIIRLV